MKGSKGQFGLGSELLGKTRSAVPSPSLLQYAPKFPLPRDNTIDKDRTRSGSKGNGPSGESRIGGPPKRSEIKFIIRLMQLHPYSPN